jgi:predicted Rdx family selenoprotein
VAEHLKEELDVEAILVKGGRGEFSVRINGTIVIEKKGDEFPSPAQCVDAVSRVID